MSSFVKVSRPGCVVLARRIMSSISFNLPSSAGGSTTAWGASSDNSHTSAGWLCWSQIASMYLPAPSGNLCWTSAIIFLCLSVHESTPISTLTLRTILNHNRRPPENSTPCRRPPDQSRRSMCLNDVRSQPSAHCLKVAVITLLLLIYILLFDSHLEQCPLGFIFRVDADPSFILSKQCVSALVAG